MTKATYISAEGLKKLKGDLDRMLNIERPAISKLIGEAIEKGDISENAEYDAAKDAQGMLEAKIAVLQDQIANARIIDQSKISVSTPIAKGLLGKKIGDVVEIQVPSGVIPFEIINIELGQ